MSARGARIAAAVAMIAALAACEQRLTEIVVVVSSDVADLSQVSMRVLGPNGDVGVDESVALGAPGAPELPLTLSLTRQAAPYEPVTITVTGQSASAGTIVRTVSTGFVPDERRVLAIVLEAACGGVSCAGGQTCIRGACAADAIDPAGLPPFEGEIPAIDAGTPRDAGPGDDAGPPGDGGVDGGQDGGPPGGCVPACRDDELCVYGACLAGPWSSVAIGEEHLCMVERAPGPVRCTGANGSGQLGDGTTVARGGFVGAIGIADAVAVTAGRGHTCAITAGGEALCWGSNAQGQLGVDVAVADTTVPSRVVFGGPDTMVTAIAAGNDHTCAVRGGEVLCWGANTAGQLGDGTRVSRGTTGTSVLTDAIAVAGGAQFTCAVVSTGIVWCWGNNGSGQLGDGSTTQRLAPVMVSGAVMRPDVTQVVAGLSHACALRMGGSVLCWGDGGRGQLGDGATDDNLVPVQTTDFGLAGSIASGTQHVVSRRQDGELWGWGDNASMQLAPLTTTTTPTPAELDTTLRIDAVWAGAYTTCFWEQAVGPRCIGATTLP